PAAEQEAREVAGDRTRPDDADEREHVDLPLAGHDPAEQHRRLARGDQADERTGLEERERADEEIGPRAEGLADRDQRLLEVRQLDDARAVHGDDDDGDRTADEQRRLELAPAPDEEGRERRGG